MAYSQATKYIWPPNFTEGTDTMGDNQRRICVQVDGVVATSGDASDVVTVDRSDLIGPAGAIPSKLVIERLEWDIQGFNEVTLEWDEATDELIARLTDQGIRDYRAEGGLVPNSAFASAADGDILLTTVGGADLSKLSIKIWARLKE